MFLRLSATASAVLFSLSFSAAAETRTAPQPGCLDARIVETVHVASDSLLAVATQDGQRFRVDLHTACDAALASGAELGLLAREGWVCGAGNEFVQVQGAQGLCPIAGLASVDAREFARIAREAGARTLAQVEVKGRKPGFGGSADFCFASSQVRSWAESNQGLQVEVGQRGRRGSRSYRVELDDTCPDLGRFQNVEFESGAKNGLICGNTGDAVLVLDDRAAQGVASTSASRMGSRCTIREVFPLAQAGG